MGALVTALVRELPDDAVAAIVEQAEGNPLFAVETIRSLIDRDVIIPRDREYRLVGDVGALSVPDSLHGLLAARLDALESGLRALVADAAVLGSTFSSDALAAVSGRAVEEVTSDLTELVRRGVLEVSTDPLSPQRGSYAFSHHMLRQVAYDTLSRRERRVRHLAVAEHLQSIFASGGDEVMDLIAQHYLDALGSASDETDPEVRQRAFASLVRAAERSMRAGALLHAAQSFERAADLVAETDAVEAARQWERAGVAYERGGLFQPAYDAAHRGHEIYLALAESRNAARALAAEGIALLGLGRVADARAALEEALEELRPEPDVDTVRALLEAARVAAFSARPEGRALAEEAIGLGQALGVPLPLMARLFACRGLIDAFEQRRLEATAAFQFSAELADRCGDREVQGRALLNLSAALVCVDAPAAAAAARSAAEVGRVSGHRFIVATAVTNLAVAGMVSGTWDETLAELESTMHDDGLEDFDFVVAVYVLFLALRGDLARAGELTALEKLRSSDDVQDIGVVRWVDAVLAAESGNPALALTHLREQLGSDGQLDLSFEGVFWSWPLAVQCAFDVGDLDEVRRLLALLDAQPPGHVPPVLRGCRALARARLTSVVAEEPEEAVEDAFGDGIALLREAASPFHLAQGLIDHAAYLHSCGRDAAPHLAEATLIGERLGAADVRRRAESLGFQQVPA